MHLNRLASSKKLGSLGALPSSPQIVQDNLRQEGAQARGSILDFEHLFVQYFVEVPCPQNALACVCFGSPERMTCSFRYICPREVVPRRPRGARCGRRWSAGSEDARLAQPSAWEVAQAWKEVLLDLMVQHKALILQHWPELQLTRKGLERRLNEELAVKDELSSSKSRVLLTLAPEQVCHRLLWALGDSIPTEVALQDCTRQLQKRFPQSHIRCSDNWFCPASVIRTLFGLASLLLALGLRAATTAARVVYEAESPAPGKKRKVDVIGPTWEELLDQLSARLILASSLGYLWLLYGIAAAFPLRSLHSPFQRQAQLQRIFGRQNMLRSHEALSGCHGVLDLR